MWQLRKITVSSRAPSTEKILFCFLLFFRLHCKMEREAGGVTAQQVTQHQWTAVGNKHKWRTRKWRRPLGERWKTLRSHWYAGWEAVERTLLTYSSEIYPCDDIHVHTLREQILLKRRYLIFPPFPPLGLLFFEFIWGPNANKGPRAAAAAEASDLLSLSHMK